MKETGKCPTCGKSGHVVDGATVKSMLAVSLRHVQNIIYHFCANADCYVVYYSEDAQTFTTHEVRERVYQKEPESDDVLICYCFQHTFANSSPKQITKRSLTTSTLEFKLGNVPATGVIHRVIAV